MHEYDTHCSARLQRGFLTRQAPFKFTHFHLTTAKPLRLLLLSDAGPTKENDGAVACGGLDG